MKKALKISLKVLMWFFVALILIAVAVQTSPVQNFAKEKVVNFLKKKLKTHVAIGRVRIGFPNSVAIENIYLEDKTKDTLLYGGRIKASINLFKLISNEVKISDLRLQNMTAKIKRQLPDTVYNFQFVIDAFVTENTQPPDPADTAAAMKMALDNLYLDSIRFVYRDTISGNDWTIQLQHFDTHIKTIDPAKQFFDVPSITLDGLTARMYQWKPLVATEEVITNDTGTAPLPAIRLRQIRLTNIDVDYKNDVSAFYTLAKLANVQVQVQESDLNSQRIVLDQVRMTGVDAGVLMGKSPPAKLVAEKAKKEVEDLTSKSWYIAVNDLRLQKSRLRFDDENQPRQPQTLDYGHLKAEDINIQVNNMMMNLDEDSIAANVARAAFKEQSGFTLQELKGQFLYTAKKAEARELFVKTPGTLIKHTIAISYPSLESIQKNIGLLQVNAKLPGCYIANRDILFFVPDLRQQPMFSNPATVFKINADVEGRVDRLTARVLQIQGWGHTRLDVEGTVVGLPSMDKLYGDVRINEIKTTQQDANQFLPTELQAQINVPAQLRLSGTARGNGQNMQTNLHLNSSSGNVVLTGTMANYQNTQAASYNLNLQAQNLDVGYITKDTSMQTLSAQIQIQGKGLTAESADATLKGAIQSLVYQQYNYRDIALDGAIRNQLAQGRLSIEDPNIHLAGNVSVNLALNDPAITADLQIDSIKTQPLHLTPNTFVYRGKIRADMSNVNPDSLQGEIDIIHSLVVTDQGRLQLDTVTLRANQNGDSSRITLTSDIARMRMAGKYKLTQLGSIIQQAIQPYFTIMPKTSQPPAKIDPYNFRLGMFVRDNPALKVFFPALQRFQHLRLNARFASDSGWQANVNMPVLVTNAMALEDLDLQAGAADSALNLTTNLASLQMAGNTIYNLYFNASAADDSLNFDTRFNDRAGRIKYALGGFLKQPEYGVYDISLRSDSLLLNYEEWTVAPNNLIHLGKDDIRITDFMLNRHFQQISIKSRGEGLNAPAEASFTSFKISTLAAFVTPDSLGIDGTLDGQITLRDLMKQPIFSGDLVINDLNFRKDTLGKLAIKANNTNPDIINADLLLTGHGNHATIKGNYYTKRVNGNDFDFDISIDTINMATIEGATMGAITGASGQVTGKFTLAGTTDKLNIDGGLRIRQTSFNLVMLNNVFSIEDETITVNNEGIRFDRFELLDSAKNKATLNGMVYTTDFSDYRFDLSLRANNFRAMNSTKQQNRLYWGKLLFSTNMTIKGTPTQPVVDGNLTIGDETNVTVVLPQQDPGVVDREGIVRFIDMDAPGNDTLFLQEQVRYDSLNRSVLTGMDINVNLEVKKEAIFSLVIDEGNGDFLRMQGEGMITGGIDPSGKITMTGTYVIQNGAYELSYNLLKRKFTIQQGSKITWNGEPTMADLDVTAVYTVKTAPLDLVSGQLSAEESEGSRRNTYLQRIPFEVLLTMRGELMQPQISFDIKLPEGDAEIGESNVTTINNRLNQLRQEPSELNKQVFALLLLNRFIQDNPFESSGGGLTPEYLARQSASKLLTEQLNKVAGDLIQGVDINFDLTSFEDYSTGNAKTRTDLNVSLSKRLLNDRLTVTVGNNFGLEGTQNTNRNSSNLAGNVAVDYSLSKDGRYRVRAYRKNEYEGVIEGYVIETGVGFVITLDYNRFRNLFLSKKEKEQRRQQRLQRRKREAQQEEQEQQTPSPQTTFKPMQNQELEKREEI